MRTRALPRQPGTRCRPRVQRARAAMALLAFLPRPVEAQSQLAAPAQPLDRLTLRAERGDGLRHVSGVIVENRLNGVVIELDGEPGRYASELVLGIDFGEPPAGYADGLAQTLRGEHESAAAHFELAVEDAAARPLVRAAARLRAAEALLAAGARDPSRFSSAAEEARRFLAEHEDNREVPQAQRVLARALLLSGRPGEAAAVSRAVYGRLTGGQAAPGYDRTPCYQAGLEAARSLLAAGDTLAARELFGQLASRLGPELSDSDSQDLDPDQHALRAVVDEALLGSGFAELSSGNYPVALAFFQEQRSALGPEDRDTRRHVVLLGLGEALLAAGRPRQAQIALAQVSAMDCDRDRVARALLRQAEAGIELGDPRASLLPILEAIDRQFGDTPSASGARELLRTL